MGPGDELRIPLRIDTSAVYEDLRAVDAELARLERRVVQTFNRLDIVGRGAGALAPPATGISDIRSFLQSGLFTRAALESASPQLAEALRSVERREQALRAQAEAGRGVLPPTERQEAQSRLAALEQQRQTRPQQITAGQEYFDKLTLSIRKGMPAAATLAAGATGIPGASRLASALMGFAAGDPLLGGLAGVGLGAGGLALAASAQQASFQRQQAALSSALVGGPAFGETRTLLGLSLMTAAQQMSTSREEGQRIAQQLGAAGMAPGPALRNMQNVLAYSKAYGLPAGSVEAIVGALGTAGAMSPRQIGETLRQLVSVASSATGSVLQLVTGVQALSTVNQAAARDAYSLAAIQRVVGPTSGVNAGALMQTAMGATGASALQMAGMLGMTPDAFLAAQQSGQGGMATLFNRYAALARRAGPGAAGIEVAEMLLQQAGLNLQGLSATQQAALVQRLRSAPPGQALAYYRQLMSTPKPAPAAPSPPRLIQAQTSPWEQFWLAFENWKTSLLNAPHPAGAPTSATGVGGAPLPMLFPIPSPSGTPSASAGAAGAAGQGQQITLGPITLQGTLRVTDSAGRSIGSATITPQSLAPRVVTGGTNHGHPPPGHPQNQAGGGRR